MPALTVDSIDILLANMESCLDKVNRSQNSIVKLRNAEVDLLQVYEAARDSMIAMLSSSNREVLQAVFGGDCDRIARIIVNLESAKFSDMYAADPRISGCKSACESVEKVLQDLGLGWALRQALEKEKENAKRKTVINASEIEAAKVAATAKMETSTLETNIATIDGGTKEPPKEEPLAPAEELEEPPSRPKPPSQPKTTEPVKLREAATEALMATGDEEIIERILACTEAAELVELEPSKTDALANWMIWMVHRAHLNDPTLMKFDFTNLQMPAGHEEPRISPKLAKAMEKNTHITELLLPNTKLMAKEGAVLAESLASNSSVRILNVDSNFLSHDELEALANAAGTSKTLEELRLNNQHGVAPGRQLYEALTNAVKANTMIVKLGLTISDAHYRNEIDRQIMRNSDLARKRRVEARKAAGAAVAA